MRDFSAGPEPAALATRSLPGEFCRAVGEIVQRSAEKETPGRVAALLPELLSSPDFLTEAQRAAPLDGYGRNRLFICPGGLFSVLAMVWPPGIATPVHDHLTWCAFGVYEGTIEETRYRPAADGATAHPVSRVRHAAGDAGYLPLDAPDIHCLSNPTGAPAISIHVYGGDCEQQGPNLRRIYAVEG